VVRSRSLICGNSGCWEQYASDFAFIRLYAEHASLASGRELGTEAIIAKVRADDPLAAEVLRETARYVALPLCLCFHICADALAESSSPC